MKSRIYKLSRYCCLTASLAIIALAGCQQQQSYSFSDSIHKKALFGQKTIFLAGKSVQNRDITCYIHGNGSQAILIMAAIHGNETGGIKIVEKLNDILDNQPYKTTGKTIILIPVANPDGYADRTRYNANGVDLNRNFATNNRINNKTNGLAAVSEPETRAVADLIDRYNPSIIISIHSPLGCIDYDGPAGILAENISKDCKLGIRKLGSRPGSLGSYAGLEKGIPVITIELEGNDDLLTTSQIWDKYGKAMLNVIEYTPVTIL